MIADLDDDGNQDVTLGFNEQVAVLFGRGDGTFELPVEIAAPQLGTSFPTVADLDGDGLRDIVVNSVRHVWLILQDDQAPRQFEDAQILMRTGFRETGASVALDLDGANGLDVVVAFVTAPHGIKVGLNPGLDAMGNLQLPFTPDDNLPSAVLDLCPGESTAFEGMVAMDLTGSGRLDLLVSDQFSSVADGILSRIVRFRAGPVPGTFLDGRKGPHGTSVAPLAGGGGFQRRW